MIKVNPWGPIEWLLPKIGEKEWTVISCASFEDRCSALPLLVNNDFQVKENYIIQINDPQNQYSHEIGQRTNKNLAKFNSLKNKNLLEVDLLTMSSKLKGLVSSISQNPSSVILDMSTMPKRGFLFLVKQLLKDKNISDLVVCYTKPLGYKEGELSENYLPPAAIPGFARETQNTKDSIVIIGVGYVGFNLGELLEQAKGKQLKFLFPFPPGSPSFRRNWGLLHKLTNPDIALDTEIKRMHASDVFGAYEWLMSLHLDIAPYNIDMIPLGPKPHALAMALAHMKYNGKSELIYSQPQIYHPDYSTGIKMTHDNKPDITAYCLKRNDINFFDY